MVLENPEPLRSTFAPMPGPAETSRRLKAARWLAGGVDENGKPKQLKVAELAHRAPLPENGISANRIEEIEQLTITAPPMELEKIADALDLPHEWFTAEVPAEARSEALQNAAATMGPLLLAAVQALRLAQEQEPPDTDEPDRPAGSAGGDDG